MTEEYNPSEIEKIFGKRAFVLLVLAALCCVFGLIAWRTGAEQAWTITASVVGVLGVLVTGYTNQVSIENQTK